MDPNLLNNLYLVGGLLAAMFMIVRRFTKDLGNRIESGLERVENRLGTVKGDVSNLQTEMADVKDRLEKVDDRVRDLQMDMAVVKDRLNILTGDRPASPAVVRAGASIPQAAAAEA